LKKTFFVVCYRKTDKFWSLCNMRKNLLLTLFLLFLFGAVTAFPQEPPRIRAGVVSSQEFTTEKPSSEGKSPLSGQSSSAWAVLTVTLDSGRAMSIFDYTLRKDGEEFKCLDIAEGNDPFKGTVRIYRSTEPGKKCRIVFPIPSADSEYEILFKLLPGQERPVKLNVKAPPPAANPKAGDGKK